jgi:crotonobetainyl-CoA:carnitine CoA-transferase CaiB-like acyl-CoA transferase
VAEWTAELSRDEVVGRLRAEGLRVYPVNSMADLFEDPQLAARGFWRTVDHPVMGPLRVEAPPALLRSTPPVQERAAPLMGAHTAEVLGDLLGLSPAEIDGLYADGALD